MFTVVVVDNKRLVSLINEGGLARDQMAFRIAAYINACAVLITFLPHLGCIVSRAPMLLALSVVEISQPFDSHSNKM